MTKTYPLIMNTTRKMYTWNLYCNSKRTTKEMSKEMSKRKSISKRVSTIIQYSPSINRRMYCRIPSTVYQMSLTSQ